MSPRSLWKTTALAAVGLLAIAVGFRLYLAHLSAAALHEAAQELNARAAESGDTHYTQATEAIVACLDSPPIWFPQREAVNWTCVDERYRARNGNEHPQQLRLVIQRLLLEQQRLLERSPLMAWLSS